MVSIDGCTVDLELSMWMCKFGAKEQTWPCCCFDEKEMAIFIRSQTSLVCVSWLVVFYLQKIALLTFPNLKKTEKYKDIPIAYEKLTKNPLN